MVELEDALPALVAIWAFADDIGLTSANIAEDWPVIVEAFCDFAQFSGLCVNISKTILMPLGFDSIERIRAPTGSGIPAGTTSLSLSRPNTLGSFWVQWLVVATPMSSRSSSSGTGSSRVKEQVVSLRGNSVLEHLLLPRAQLR